MHRSLREVIVRLAFLPALFVGAAIEVLLATSSLCFGQQAQRQPILIPGIQEPEEMRVAPVSAAVPELTAPEREIAQATENFSKINDPTVLTALNQVLSKYPDFADGYVFRLKFLCDANDRQAAL